MEGLDVCGFHSCFAVLGALEMPHAAAAREGNLCAGVK